ncbi:RNA polymerase sigma factor [Aestuariibaculum marinum]|uniref:RNA polymerase sigma-70 factor n=1 Tax=Aestuariibaculum marinum TaxID=2683592 RepID=A0A8J6PWS6_9FLAO|nr:RNA polymerase sigma-70 factor [Aestuariibaculum marinum]MBD0825454.1 RNA polymerase sigma-70 factor [Aestuariibaculum marinum]
MDNNKSLNIILKKLKNGDQDIFEKIYLEYHEILCIFLLSYTNDKNLIEDIVHDVFIKLWNKRKTVNITTSIKSYLYRSAYNKFIDTHREQKKQTEMLSSYYYTAVMQAINIDHSKKDDIVNKLDTCIKSLPKKCKNVFIKNKIEGQKYHQISQDLNISLKTVEGHITKAYKLIKGCLQINNF